MNTASWRAIGAHSEPRTGGNRWVDYYHVCECCGRKRRIKTSRPVSRLCRDCISLDWEPCQTCGQLYRAGTSMANHRRSHR